LLGLMIPEHILARCEYLMIDSNFRHETQVVISSFVLRVVRYVFRVSLHALVSHDPELGILADDIGIVPK
jgi:hypothetical protein